MHLKRVIFHPDKYPTREHYPFNLEIFHKTRGIEFNSPVTFFAGENGTGKSTLLKALCHKCGIYIWGEIERTRVKSNPFEKALFKSIEVE